LLYTKKSQIPKAGLGLFTDSLIKKGQKVVEYLGEIITWPEAEKRDTAGKGGYVYYITEKFCIDAYKHPEHLARYANDARGIGRRKGIRNNCIYESRGKRGYIVATRNIKPGEEIFVWYGTDYWKPWLETYNEMKKKEKAAKRKSKSKEAGKQKKHAKRSAA
jgi:SET domain-containing protein